MDTGAAYIFVSLVLKRRFMRGQYTLNRMLDDSTGHRIRSRCAPRTHEHDCTRRVVRPHAFFAVFFVVAVAGAFFLATGFSGLGHGYQSIRFDPTNTITPALISRPSVSIFTTP